MPLVIVLALLAAAAGCWMFRTPPAPPGLPADRLLPVPRPGLLTGVIAAALAMAATVGIDLVLTSVFSSSGPDPLHAA